MAKAEGGSADEIELTAARLDKAWKTFYEKGGTEIILARKPGGLNMGSKSCMKRIAAFLVFFAVFVSAQGALGAPAPCADPLEILRAFYDSNDARNFDAGARYLADDAVFATWATGVQGYVVAQKHLKGKDAIRRFLADARGVRWHLPGAAADGPVYHDTRIGVTGDTVRFTLEPDRKRPNGRPYPPFKVEARVKDCTIVSLTVVEEVTWL